MMNEKLNVKLFTVMEQVSQTAAPAHIYSSHNNTNQGLINQLGLSSKVSFILASHVFVSPHFFPPLCQETRPVRNVDQTSQTRTLSLRTGIVAFHHFPSLYLSLSLQPFSLCYFVLSVSGQSPTSANTQSTLDRAAKHHITELQSPMWLMWASIVSLSGDLHVPQISSFQSYNQISQQTRKHVKRMIVLFTFLR